MEITSESEKRFDKFCKVPSKITFVFWIVKCCATTVGETLSDYFNVNLGFGLGGAAGLFYPLLLINLCFQLFWFRKYSAPCYWLAVVLMSICGTIFTDGLHDNLGVELWIEIIIFFFLMCCSFGAWYKIEGSLDIHSITTLPRETFYWTAVLFTFALGTAVGDIISETAGLGYGVTLALFVGVIIFIALLWYFKVLDEVTSFWFAYIMTRPLGAAAGDLLASPLGSGGAGIGAGGTSGIFSGIIALCVIYLSYTRVDMAEMESVSTKDTPEDSSPKETNQIVVRERDERDVVTEV